MQDEYPEVILASASGARAAILASASIRFRQLPSALNEAEEHKHFAGGTSPMDVAKTLARLKADNVQAREPGAVIIGADQVLAIGAEVLQKPRNQIEARGQLQRLRGCTHELHSAAVVLYKGHAACFADTAILDMREFSDPFLDWYLETAGEAVLTSAGAYHIEGLGIHLFSRIRGDYFTILGLPVLPVLQELRRISVISK